ncbi:MAG: hypothetical protein ACE5JC_00170 [Candidatus Zixiibacteriota bacterium]
MLRVSLALVLLWGMLFARAEEKQDMWEPLRFLVGEWEGTLEGKSGVGKLEQESQFVLGGKFLQMRNKATFEPQEKNPKGEVHQDWGVFSYDTNREKFVFRQFHVEGFVNQYVLDSISEDGKTLVFITEQIENISPGWRAKLTYKIPNDDEFQQIFELAGPGKDFGCYSRGTLKRKS